MWDSKWNEFPTSINSSNLTSSILLNLKLLSIIILHRLKIQQRIHRLSFHLIIQQIRNTPVLCAPLGDGDGAENVQRHCGENDSTKVDVKGKGKVYTGNENVEDAGDDVEEDWGEDWDDGGYTTIWEEVASEFGVWGLKTGLALWNTLYSQNFSCFAVQVEAMRKTIKQMQISAKQLINGSQTRKNVLMQMLKHFDGNFPRCELNRHDIDISR